jgi:hypothetical protein
MRDLQREGGVSGPLAIGRQHKGKGKGSGGEWDGSRRAVSARYLGTLHWQSVLSAAHSAHGQRFIR